MLTKQIVFVTLLPEDISKNCPFLLHESLKIVLINIKTASYRKHSMRLPWGILFQGLTKAKDMPAKAPRR